MGFSQIEPDVRLGKHSQYFVGEIEISRQKHKSTLISKNITVLGRRTSVRLEPEMWDALYDIAKREGASIHSICSLIQLKKVRESTLTAAIRVFLLLYYRASSTVEGHLKARHGCFDAMKSRVNISDEILSEEKQKRKLYSSM